MGLTILTRYVPSALNPANGPSRGIYPLASLLLPLLPIHPTLIGIIHDISISDIQNNMGSLNRHNTSKPNNHNQFHHPDQFDDDEHTTFLIDQAIKDDTSTSECGH